MTSDHSTPRCLRCPDTALRLIDRGAFAVSRDAGLSCAIRRSFLCRSRRRSAKPASWSCG